MKCPVCKDKDLVMSERSGIEIDYCPECRGVWLDRGELDKIIERNMASQQETYREPAPQKKKNIMKIKNIMMMTINITINTPIMENIKKEAF